jgi:hypothetical protein
MMRLRWQCHDNDVWKARGRAGVTYIVRPAGRNYSASRQSVQGRALVPPPPEPLGIVSTIGMAKWLCEQHHH